MSGVVFVVCVPSANYEKRLRRGYGEFPENSKGDENNFLHVGINLRDKNQQRIPMTFNQDERSSLGDYIPVERGESLPLEKILERLLKKLEVEHVVWFPDKEGNYFEVFFPVASGDPCENVLHCLTELGIGKKLNSVVSVLPCSVVYSSLKSDFEKEEVILRNTEERKQWKSFVESIRSKLTVKQVVDGVRSGGKMSFDYLLLIVTADSLAALGLVENNSPNIVAAMLVSPLMGPVMSITFGTIISDRSLQKSGFYSLVVGMFISCLFGFIFGLILGTTEMPWGFGDWPTEEMKGRGNVRSLWMGVLWALTSGSGVAVALLQGSAGPLIGVAISASLLPPVVNCGLYWALACIWLIYKDVKIPHLKGEAYTGNSSYVPLYSDYIPTEFAINGIVSACLTIVNVICIFITAILVLKIKEVAAPYTSSPDLQRFWQHDIKLVREGNRASMKAAEEAERREYMMDNLESEDLGEKLDEAVREAIDDDTFRKVQRVSYQTHGLDDISRLFLNNSLKDPAINKTCSLNRTSSLNKPSSLNRTSSLNIRRRSSYRTSTMASDLATLDKMVSALLHTQSRESHGLHHLRSFRSRRGSNVSSGALATIMEGNASQNRSAGGNRQTSWSENVLDNPIISNVLNSYRNTTQPSGTQARDPLINITPPNDNA